MSYDLLIRNATLLTQHPDVPFLEKASVVIAEGVIQTITDDQSLQVSVKKSH